MEENTRGPASLAVLQSTVADAQECSVAAAPSVMCRNNKRDKVHDTNMRGRGIKRVSETYEKKKRRKTWTIYHMEPQLLSDSVTVGQIEYLPVAVELQRQ